MIRAIDGTRTRDINLGKVALYQLSYYCKVGLSVADRSPTQPSITPEGRAFSDANSF